MDLNADLGEFNNDNELDVELKLLGVITSCNIACGGHTGDRSSILKIVSAISLIVWITNTVNEANIEDTEEYLNIRETTSHVNINKRPN